MGQNWVDIIKEGNTAMKQGQYCLASSHYLKVLEEAQRKLKGLGKLSGENINVVIDFALCSRVAAKAVLKSGDFAEAENICLKASEALIPIISNLNNKQIFRAITFTHFKNIYYDLAYLHGSRRQMYKLYSYVKSHAAMVARWAEELKMVSNENLRMN